MVGSSNSYCSLTVYQDNINPHGSAAVDVKVEPGTDLAPVVDDALRLVQTSKLNPLHTIRVDVTDVQDP